jgi:hypothetical protein
VEQLTAQLFRTHEPPDLLRQFFARQHLAVERFGDRCDQCLGLLAPQAEVVQPAWGVIAGF